MYPVSVLPCRCPFKPSLLKISRCLSTKCQVQVSMSATVGLIYWFYCFVFTYQLDICYPTYLELQFSLWYICDTLLLWNHIFVVSWIFRFIWDGEVVIILLLMQFDLCDLSILFLQSKIFLICLCKKNFLWHKLQKGKPLITV